MLAEPLGNVTKACDRRRLVLFNGPAEAGHEPGTSLTGSTDQRLSMASILIVLSTAAGSTARSPIAYLLLAAARTGTMQQEVNTAAATGYRVVAASRTEGNEVVVVLERSPDKYQYRLIATTENRYLAAGNERGRRRRLSRRGTRASRRSGRAEGSAGVLAGNNDATRASSGADGEGPRGSAQGQYTRSSPPNVPARCRKKSARPPSTAICSSR